MAPDQRHTPRALARIRREELARESEEMSALLDTVDLSSQDRAMWHAYDTARREIEARTAARIEARMTAADIAWRRRNTIAAEGRHLQVRGQLPRTRGRYSYQAALDRADEWYAARLAEIRAEYGIATEREEVPHG